MGILTVRGFEPADEPEVAEIDRLAIADLRRVYQPTLRALEARSAIGSHLERLVAVWDGHVAGVVQYRVVAERVSFRTNGFHCGIRRTVGLV